MIRRSIPAFAAFAAIALAACAGGGEPASSPTVPDATATTVAPGVTAAATGASDAVIPPALDFSAPLLGGGEIELGAFAGRPVLLWFWAPW